MELRGCGVERMCSCENVELKGYGVDNMWS